MEYRTADRIGRTGLGRLTSKLMMQNDASLPSALGEAIKMKMKATGTRFLSNIDPLNIVRLASFKSPLITTLAGKLMGRSRKDISYFTGNRYGEDLEQESPSKKDKKNDGVYHTRIGPGRLVSVRSGDGLADIMAKLYNLTRHHYEQQMSEEEKKKLFSPEDKEEQLRRLKELFGKDDSSKAKKIEKEKKEREKEKDSIFGDMGDIASWFGKFVTARSLFNLLYRGAATLLTNSVFWDLLGIGVVVGYFKKWFNNFLPDALKYEGQELKIISTLNPEEDAQLMANRQAYQSRQDKPTEAETIRLTQLSNESEKLTKESREKGTTEGRKAAIQTRISEIQKEKNKIAKDRQKRYRETHPYDMNYDYTDYTKSTMESDPTYESMKTSKMQFTPSNEREKFAYQFFKEKGYSDFAAAGIVSNLSKESGGLQPDIVNKEGGGKGAYGIAQLRGSRQDNLKRMYGEKPTLEQQLEFVDMELTNGDSASGLVPLRESLQAVRSVKEASDLILHKYEKPFTDTTPMEKISKTENERFEKAQSLYNEATNQNIGSVEKYEIEGQAKREKKLKLIKEMEGRAEAIRKMNRENRPIGEKLKQKSQTQPEQKLQTQDKVSSLGPRLQTAQNMKNAFESSQGNNVVVAPNNSKIVNNNVMTGGGGGGSPGISIRNDEPALKVAQQKYSMLATV